MYNKKKKYILLIFQNIAQILEKKLFFFLIPNEKQWYYIAVKKLRTLLGGITSKHHGLNCFHSFVTKNILQTHRKICENKGLINTKISDKTPFIFFANLECLIEKTDGCKNNSENSSITKVGEHIPSSFQCLQYLHLKT